MDDFSDLTQRFWIGYVAQLLRNVELTVKKCRLFHGSVGEWNNGSARIPRLATDRTTHSRLWSHPRRQPDGLRKCGPQGQVLLPRWGHSLDHIPTRIHRGRSSWNTTPTPFHRSFESSCITSPPDWLHTDWRGEYMKSSPHWDCCRVIRTEKNDFIDVPLYGRGRTYELLNQSTNIRLFKDQNDTAAFSFTMC